MLQTYCYCLIMKPNRCNNVSNLFLVQNSTCFGQILCPSSGVFHCKHSNGICHTGLLTACEQAVSKPVWHTPLLCVQWKTPDDGQRNCPKHVEFYSKNKFGKLVHLVGLIIRIYHDALSPERQNVAHCFLLFNYCSDMFRPQFLAIFSELICLCSLYAEVDIQAAQNY